MHDATCGDCGKTCQVPFEPRQDKPVYCNDCFQNHKPERSDRGRGRFGGNRGGGRFGGRGGGRKVVWWKIWKRQTTRNAHNYMCRMWNRMSSSIQTKMEKNQFIVMTVSKTRNQQLDFYTNNFSDFFKIN